MLANRLISTIIRAYPRYFPSASRFTRCTPLLSPKSQFSTVLLPKPAVAPRLLDNPEIAKIGDNITRSVTKFSIRKGRRKTVRTVLKRFYRLQWGGWIRTIAGRHKHLWKKKNRRRWRIQRHVLCNGKQSYMLDKMVNRYWKKPRYYVDDPYEPYHTRTFKWAYTKPKPYFPPEDEENVQ